MLGLPAPRRDRPRAGVRGHADRRAAQGPHACARRSPTPPACSPTPGRSTRCWSSAGISGIAERKVGQVLRGRAAAAPVRDGAALRPGAAAARRAHHRHGRRGTARLLVRDPPRRRAGPHGAVRDPLPRGGRPVRRPDRADAARAGSSRTAAAARSRRSPPAARCGPPWHVPTTQALAGSAASSRSRSAATPCCVHAKDTDAVARYLLTADRRPRPGDHRPRHRGRVPQPHRRHRGRRPPTTADHAGDPDEHTAPSTRPPGASRRSAASTPPCCGIELRRMLRNRRTHHLHADVPGRAVLRVRRRAAAGTSRPAAATWRPTSWSRWRCTARR